MNLFHFVALEMSTQYPFQQTVHPPPSVRINQYPATLYHGIMNITIVRFSPQFSCRYISHWTYWLQILSELCFQRVALSGNYEIVAITTDKNTFF